MIGTPTAGMPVFATIRTDAGVESVPAMVETMTGDRWDVRVEDTGEVFSLPVEDLATVGCEWFALCDHTATTLRHHPIVGNVPICERCDHLLR